MTIKGRLFILISVCAVCLLLSLNANWLAMTGSLDSILPPSEETLMNRHFYHWRTSPIPNYRIEVHVREAYFPAQSYILTVRDHQIIAQEVECIPHPNTSSCQLQPFEINDFTVEGLFAKLYAWYDSTPHIVYATFDATNHLPLRINYDDPERYDDDISYVVVSFEPQ
jgi:hypothetical protein